MLKDVTVPATATTTTYCKGDLVSLLPGCVCQLNCPLSPVLALRPPFSTFVSQTLPQWTGHCCSGAWEHPAPKWLSFKAARGDTRAHLLVGWGPGTFKQPVTHVAPGSQTTAFQAVRPGAGVIVARGKNHNITQNILSGRGIQNTFKSLNGGHLRKDRWT